MAPGHVGFGLVIARPIAEIVPAIDHLFGRAAADAELEPPSGDDVGGAGVFGHIERVLVAHIDHRRADFDTAGLRANRGQQRERRGKLAGKVMHPEIGAVRPQFLGSYGKVDGLEQRVGCRAGLRALCRRPVSKRQEPDFLHWFSIILIA